MGLSREQSNLTRAMRRAKRRKLFGSLALIYAALPETKCEHCTRCCHESPGLFYVEYLGLMDYLSRLPQPARQALLRRALRELLFSWIEPDSTCIFLESSQCALYEQRPLSCRLFGLAAPADPMQAEVEARMAAREEARRWGLLGIRIPEAVIARSLVSCERVTDSRGRPVRVDGDALTAEVGRLDEALLPREVVVRQFCFLSLPERLGAALVGSEVVDTMRIQLLRRAQRGEPVGDLIREVWDILRGDSREGKGERGKER